MHGVESACLENLKPRIITAFSIIIHSYSAFSRQVQFQVRREVDSDE